MGVEDRQTHTAVEERVSLLSSSLARALPHDRRRVTTSRNTAVDGQDYLILVMGNGFPSLLIIR